MQQTLKKPVVFLAFANTIQHGYLEQLKKESSSLRDIFAPLHKEGRIEFLREESIELIELTKLLGEYKDQIVMFHYGGHADGKHLNIEGSEGNVQGLARLLSLQKALKFVFLNGCSTQAQAKPYLEAGIPVVLATNKRIPDEDATRFAHDFYHALVNHHTIREAYSAASGSLLTHSKSYRANEKSIITYHRNLDIEPVGGQDMPWQLYVQEGDEEVLDWQLSKKMKENKVKEEMEPEALKNKSTPLTVWAGIIVTTIAVLAGIAELTGYSLKDYLATPAIASNTVLIKVKSQISNIDLPKKGEVYLNYGNAQIEKEINNNNEAIFTEVPEGYFKEGNNVKVTFVDPEGSPYYAVYADSNYQLTPNQSIELLVGLRGLNKLYGIIKDFETGTLLQGARISVLNIDTLSNENGWWELEIKEEENIRQFHTVRASKEGYHDWEQQNIPAQTDQEISIMLKPKK